MFKTIKQKVKFKASPKEIYELLADSKKFQTFSSKKATISKNIGGAFTTDSGYSAGINVDLVSGKRIVQAWRGADFPSGIFSMATFNFAPTRSGGTELTLTHRGVPKELIPSIEKRWRDHYWAKIKKYLQDKN